MLEIQKFIYEHDNWRELLSAAPYNLKISEDDGYVLFKYNQITSDFNEEICKEARGLILDSTDNFRVVRQAFGKFFNLGESHAATLDWDSAIATSKEDGSLISVWFARGQWHISSNGTIDAYKAELSNSAIFPYKNFGQLFEAAAKNCNLNWENLDSNYIYTFELCSPANKVVLTYPEPKLFHILTRSAATLEEIEMDIGVEKPREYKLSSQKDYEALVASMDDTHEGIVVRDKNCNRVKIKTTTYFTLHHLMNNGAITLERIVDLIRANDQYEFLSYFQKYKPIFDNVQEQMTIASHRVTAIKGVVERWKMEHQFVGDERVKRKCFAQYVGKENFAPLLFAEYDGRLDALLQNITTPKYISLFHIVLPEVR